MVNNVLVHKPKPAQFIDLAWYKVRVCHSYHLWHISNPTSQVFGIIGTLDNIVLICCGRTQIVGSGTNKSAVFLVLCCLGTFCFCLMLMEHTINFSLTIFFRHCSNIDVDRWCTILWFKSRTLSHMWLIMLTFNKMIGCTVGNSCTVDTNAHFRYDRSSLFVQCDCIGKNKWHGWSWYHRKEGSKWKEKPRFLISHYWVRKLVCFLLRM